jgi:hypothetical protein
VEKSDDIEPKAVAKLRLKGDIYNNSSDKTKDMFID